jgi:hypothetical protein
MLASRVAMHGDRLRQERLLVELVRRFRRLTPEQKIRATLLNNSATRRLMALGAGKLHRPD